MTTLNVKVKGPCHTCAEQYPEGERPDVIIMSHADDGTPLLIAGEGGAKPQEIIPNCHLIPFLELIDEEGRYWKPTANGWIQIASPTHSE